MTFLIRKFGNINDLEEIKAMTFFKFLFDVGMFEMEKLIEDYTEKGKRAALNRYLNALSASVGGDARVFLKRKVEYIFINGYNIRIMQIFQANHDIQVVVDQYGRVKICN